MSFHTNNAGDSGDGVITPEQELFDTKLEALAAHEVKMAYKTFDASKNTPKYSYATGEIKVGPLPEGMKTGKNSATLPTGRYFIGDPCYTAGEDDQAWQKWCDVSFKGNNNDFLGALYNDQPVIGIGTAYGDGSYEDQNGRNYDVDAGMIGAVPEKLIKEMGLSDESLKGSGHWETFDNDFTISSDGEKMITIGHITIDTDPSYEDDAEAWDDEAYGNSYSLQNLEEDEDTGE